MWTVMYLCVMVIDFHDFSIGIWNCSESVLFIVLHFIDTYLTDLLCPSLQYNKHYHMVYSVSDVVDILVV